MPRYTAEQLSEYALEVIEDQAVAGMRSLQLIIVMAQLYSIEPEEAFDRICKLVIR